MKPKILIIGHARHGKGTVCEILRTEYGLTSQSSSLFSMERFLFEAFKHRYATVADLYANRDQHRAELYDLIVAYNNPPHRLASEMMQVYDIYDGMRSDRELQSCIEQSIFDFIIWVDASQRVSLEGRASFDISPSVADFVVDNNGTLDDLPREVHSVMRRIAEASHVP